MTTLPITVIIPTYKCKDFTLRALAALKASEAQPAQVIVIDNHSMDGSVEAYQAAYPEYTYVVNDKDLGYAGSNNRAIREYATQPYIWLLSSDTEVGKRSLGELFSYLSSQQRVAAVEPTLVYPDGSLQSVGGYFPTPLNVFLYLIPVTKLLPQSVKKRVPGIALFPQEIPAEGRRLDYVTGAAMLVRKQALDECGLLGEDYYMYFEETDMCVRFQRAGWSCIAIPTDPVMHVYGGSFKTPYNRKRLEITLQSLGIFVRKNCTGWKKWAMLLEITLFGRISFYIKQLKNVLN